MIFLGLVQISILQAFPPAQLISAGAGVLLSVRAAVVNLLVRARMILGFIRRLRMLKQAKVSLSISLSTSKVSLDGLKFTPKSRQLLR